MTKQSESTFEMSLLEAWNPPEGAGAPVAVIATTFEFDPHLWEINLLPRFLGLEMDTPEDKIIDPFWIEHETRLAELSCAAVLVDASKLSSITKSPLWDQIGVYVNHGILHSKIVLLQWEKCVRIIVGSANLKKSGYRFNYELFYVLDFKDEATSPPKKLLSSFIETIQHITKHTSDELLKLDPARQRLLEALKNCQSSVAKWQKMPGTYRPRADFKLEAILIEPGSRNKNDNLIAQLFKAWGTQKVSWAWIMSPFWDSPESKTKYSPMTELLPHLRSDIQAHFICSGNWIRAGKEADVNIPSIIVEQLRENTKSEIYFRPVIKDKDEAPDSDKRTLHGKSLMLYNDETNSHIFYVGSSNFTKRGTGMVSANYESGIALIRRNNNGDDLDALLPGTSKNEILKAKQVHPKLFDNLTEEVDSSSSYPPFDLLAEYDAGKKILIVNAFPGSNLPLHHLEIVHQNSSEQGQASDLLLNYSPSKISPYPFKKIMEDIPRVLELKWGENHSVLIPVQVQIRHELPHLEALQNIALDDLLHYLASSKPIWKFSHQRSKSENSSGDLNNPHKIVNTKGYMTSQVKRFSKAMAGLRRRMTDYQSTSLEGLRARFFSPFGPWSLLKAICHLVNMEIDGNNHLKLTDGSDTISTSSYNLAVFLSSELLLILKWLPFTEIYQGPHTIAVKKEWQKMITQVEKVTLKLAHFKEVNINIQSYSQRVRQEK